MTTTEITINEPLWNFPGVGEGFGIAEKLFDQGGEISVRCAYRNKQGMLTHPHRYILPTVTKDMWKTDIKHGTKLRCVPMGAFKVEFEHQETVEAARPQLPKKVDPPSEKDLWGKPLTGF